MDGSVGTGRVLLTVGVEDYYQVGSFEGLIARENWYRFETRIARNTEKALELLRRLSASGPRSSFSAAWRTRCRRSCARSPGRGHEVASRGYWHRTIRQMTAGGVPRRPASGRARRWSGRPARGSSATGCPTSCGPQDLWALDIVAEEGYAYDSSVRPLLRRFAEEPWRHTVHRHAAGGRDSGRSPPRRCSSAASRSRSPAATTSGSSRTPWSSRWSSAGRTGTALPSSCTSTSGSSTPSSRGSTPARSSPASGTTGTSTRWNGCWRTTSAPSRSPGSRSTSGSSRRSRSPPRRRLSRSQ